MFFVFFFVFFYFIKISKFALPGVMLMYERTSKDRKKEERKFVNLLLELAILRAIDCPLNTDRDFVFDVWLVFGILKYRNVASF